MEVFEIETERLQLRQFRVEDAQDVFTIFSDEQTTLDCGGYHAFDAMDEEYDRLMQKFAGPTRYSVVCKADGRVIGVISLVDAERAEHDAAARDAQFRLGLRAQIRQRGERSRVDAQLTKPRPAAAGGGRAGSSAKNLYGVGLDETLSEML